MVKITPSEHKFMFMLFEGNCHFQRTGKCSLVLTTEEVNDRLSTETYEGKSSVNYCRDLYISLKEKGQQERVRLTQYDCGHYSFTDGQHRSCIAKLAKLTLEAHVDIENNKCNKCIYPDIDARLY